MAVSDTRYPNISVPAVTPLPSPPANVDQVLHYLYRLHNVLAQNQTRLSEFARLIAYHRNTLSTEVDVGAGGTPSGGTDNMPPASGSLVQHVDIDRTTGEARLFVDIINELGEPEWFPVGGGGGGDYHIDGGHADSIYTFEQLVDGGDANG